MIYEADKPGDAPVVLAKCHARVWGGHKSSGQCPEDAVTETDKFGHAWCGKHTPRIDSMKLTVRKVRARKTAR